MTDVSTTCAVVIFKVKVSCIMSVDGIEPTVMMQLTFTPKMTTSQVVKTSVTVNNNSPIQDYVQLDDNVEPTN